MYSERGGTELLWWYFYKFCFMGGGAQLDRCGVRWPDIQWNHGRDVSARKYARLDRSLCGDMWRQTFPEATLIHLAHFHSDHCPILLQTMGTRSPGIGRRPFRFHDAWMGHRDFNQFIQDHWNMKDTLDASLQHLAQSLQS